MRCYVRGWYPYSACNLYFWKLSTPFQILLFVNLVPVFWVSNGCASTALHRHHRQQKTLFELCREVKLINVYTTGIFIDANRRRNEIILFLNNNLQDLDVCWFQFIFHSSHQIKPKMLPVWWKFIRRNLHDSYYISAFIIEHILDAWWSTILGLLANKLITHTDLTYFYTTTVK